MSSIQRGDFLQVFPGSGKFPVFHEIGGVHVDPLAHQPQGSTGPEISAEDISPEIQENFGPGILSVQVRRVVLVVVHTNDNS